MADEDQDDDIEEGAEGEGEGSSGGSKKKLFIIIGLVLLLVIGGFGAAYFFGFLNPVIEMLSGGEEAPAETTEEGAAPPADVVYYDLPELLVNLSTGERKSTYLKIRVSLELANSADMARVESRQPRIMDAFQVYLRELRIEDLKGSQGMYRLREELLRRVSVAVAPAKVNDVLFKEMLVQ